MTAGSCVVQMLDVIEPLFELTLVPIQVNRFLRDAAVHGSLGDPIASHSSTRMSNCLGRCTAAERHLSYAYASVLVGTGCWPGWQRHGGCRFISSLIWVRARRARRGR